MARSGGGAPRLGLSVSRAVGCAVRRNRVKRIIRDAFRNGRHRLPSGTDMLVIARVAAASASHCDISRELFELDRRLRTG
jgi:ribonuclease P protein component